MSSYVLPGARTTLRVALGSGCLSVLYRSLWEPLPPHSWFGWGFLQMVPEHLCPEDLRVSGWSGDQGVVHGLMYDLGHSNFFWRDWDGYEMKDDIFLLVMLEIQRSKWAWNLCDYKVNKGKAEPRKWKETFSWGWSLSPMCSHAVVFLEMAMSKLLFFPQLVWVGFLSFTIRRALIPGSNTLECGRILMWTRSNDVLLTGVSLCKLTCKGKLWHWMPVTNGKTDFICATVGRETSVENKLNSKCGKII